MKMEKLDSMKYAELQKLAKTLGIRANLKMDKLKLALTESMQQAQKPDTTTVASHLAERRPSNLPVNDNVPLKAGKRRQSTSVDRVQTTPNESLHSDGKESRSSVSRRDQTSSAAQPDNKRQRVSISPTQSVMITASLSNKRSRSSASHSQSFSSTSAVCELTSRTSNAIACDKRSAKVPVGIAYDEPYSDCVTSSSSLDQVTLNEITVSGEDDREADKTEEEEVVLNIRKKSLPLRQSDNMELNSTTDVTKKDKLEGNMNRNSVSKTSIQRRTSMKQVAPQPSARFQTKIPSLASNIIRTGPQQYSAEYWAKIHQKGFDKMESLDDYVKNRETRTTTLTTPSNLNNKLPQKASSVKRRNTSSTVVATASTATSAFTSAIRSVTTTSSFIPKVLTTSNMNLNFGQMQPTTASKSVAKKPQPEALPSSAARRAIDGVTAPHSRKSTSGILNVSVANTSQARLASRSKFDLEASLARPITWKPHLGALKAFQPVSAVISHETRVKDVKVTTRDERRERISKMRKDKRGAATSMHRNLQDISADL